MSKTAELLTSDNCITASPKNRSCLLTTMQRQFELCNVDRNQPVLVIGASQDDLEILKACGFQDIILSNLDTEEVAIDAENIYLADDSYPLVFAHAVLHHCRSPQKALGEMLRVSAQHVFFVEPNDSWALRLLTRLNLSFPYELAAVAAHQYLRGGMRDGPIPNYIYRWTAREVEKSVAAYHPERRLQVRAHPYWDFYVNEYELLARKESRVAALATKIGPSNFIRCLHLSQSLLNLWSPLRSQGNKFLCAISKGPLHPWIEARNGGHYLKNVNRNA
jgi:hypothetical protein